MDFDFSDEQKMFKDQVRKALASTCPLPEVRRVLEGNEPYSGPAWNTLKDLGVTAATIPEEYCGLGLGYYELCVAAEEVGRALAPTPLGASLYLTAEALLRAGTAAQKSAWLPRLATGDAIGCFADFGMSGQRPAYANGRLNGVCAPVLFGAEAQLAIVAAQSAFDTMLVAVPLDENVSRRRLANIDPSLPVAELTFRGSHGEPLLHSGEEALRQIRSRAAILVAFEQIGGADRALAIARDFALQRKSFGRPIGSYQAIKHKLANIYIKNEIARAHAYYGAWALASDSADLTLAAAAARVSASEAFTFASQENIQTHGGIGFTWEADCHLFYRRARFHALQLGNVWDWKEQLARLLCAQNTQSVTH